MRDAHPKRGWHFDRHRIRELLFGNRKAGTDPPHVMTTASWTLNVAVSVGTLSALLFVANTKPHGIKIESHQAPIAARVPQKRAR